MRIPSYVVIQIFGTLSVQLHVYVYMYELNIYLRICMYIYNHVRDAGKETRNSKCTSALDRF